jgi:hypothetical protein
MHPILHRHIVERLMCKRNLHHELGFDIDDRVGVGGHRRFGRRIGELGQRWDREAREPWMLECLLGSDAQFGRELQQLGQQVDLLHVGMREAALQWFDRCHWVRLEHFELLLSERENERERESERVSERAYCIVSCYLIQWQC